MTVVLPRTPPRYDTIDQNRVRLEIEQADSRNWKLTADVDFNNKLTVRDRVCTNRIDPIAGAGVGVNAAALDYVAFHMSGSFTSGGANTRAFGLNVGYDLTGADGDTVRLAQAVVDGTITTQGNSETITQVVGLYVDEPNITVGTGDTVTTAATVYIASAPTEGTNNYALFVDDGAVRIDQGVALGGGASATLGTIGGSGPGTAAQAQWLEIDIGGTVHWVPAWT